MQKYDHKRIEKKWQEKWETDTAFVVSEDAKKEKLYLLIEFPYPSGDGLHVGHARSYTAMDIIARKKRGEGKNVLYPIGWDAFGLPTENYAIKTGIHPRIVTKDNTDNFRRQLKSLGFSFDWSREINTTDPSYYKWTQWIFLKMYENGLAYKDKMPINWCLSCKIGLANEEVVDGVCERCGGPVEQREKEQWMLKITEYADRLHADLDTVDYWDRIAIQQKNWIGKSEGAEITFTVADSDVVIPVFTTRPDTLFGATYMVLAPDHELLEKLANTIENVDEVKKYQKETAAKNEIERTDEGKEKTGVLLKGVRAINPANKEEIPVYIADYVLKNYGTGAIMAVPAHDERDSAFADKFGLPKPQVVEPAFDANFVSSSAIIRTTDGKYLFQRRDNKAPVNPGGVSLFGGGKEKDESPIECLEREILEELSLDIKKLTIPHRLLEYKESKKNIGTSFAVYLIEDVHVEDLDLKEGESILEMETIDELIEHGGSQFLQDILELGIQNKPYTSSGVLINSGKFSGLESKEAKQKITEAVGGKMKTTYKLRDWIFSRQRYWGEPIPMIRCEKCGWVPVPEKDLPVQLPEVEKYEPTDTGESPLASIKEWVNTTCPKCEGEAKRETDTMPNWAGSSWYYLRYVDAHNAEVFASKSNLEYWTPVDWYNGGMEHTTLHLLYSRFWHKFLFDIGVVPTSEPYMKRTSHGLILAEGGAKMSKSKGNTVSPDEVVTSIGADSLRVYEMFMGPFDQPIAWNTDNMIGSRKWLDRIWRLQEKIIANKDERVEKELHKTIKKVTDDIDILKFNTAIAQMMSYTNIAEKFGIDKEQYKIFLQLLAPFAPHITEELWAILGGEISIHLTPWPAYDITKTKEETIKIAVQVNGKVRADIEMPADSSSEIIEEKAKKAIAHWLLNKEIKKIFYVPARLVNFVL